MLACEPDDSARERVSVLFLSREERRAHFTFRHANGEASSGSSRSSSWRQTSAHAKAGYGSSELIEEHLNEIRGAWTKHFPSGSH